VPHLVPVGDDYMVAYDGVSAFPQHLIRISATGMLQWPVPAVVYDEPSYHDTVDVAISPAGRIGFTWITAKDTLLENVEFVTIDGDVGAPPVFGNPLLVTDPQYAFCYPEIARARSSFGAAFAGEVEGSLALFLAILYD
jgi:hypothetical protein